MRNRPFLHRLQNSFGLVRNSLFRPPVAQPRTERRILLQESPLAGFQYHRGSAIWPFLQVGERLHLKREYRNPHDPHAVAVWFRNEHLGYIPRRENRALARLLDQGERLEVTIVRLLEEPNPWRKIRYRVDWIC